MSSRKCDVSDGSLAAAKTLLHQGGLYLNGRKLDKDIRIEQGDLLEERLIILKAGKTEHLVLALHPPWEDEKLAAFNRDSG